MISPLPPLTALAARPPAPDPAAGGLPGYVFDKRMRGGRYRIVNPDGSLGRMVSPDTIAAQVRDLAQQSSDRFALLARQAATGQISVAVFQIAMMRELKSLHVANAALGVGGWTSATPATWGRAGAALRTEYRHLASFAADLAAGRLTPDAAGDRGRLYADNAFGRYWDEVTRRMHSAGYGEERVRTAADDRVCPLCLDQEALGWQPINTVSVPLHLRCRCGKEYR